MTGFWSEGYMAPVVNHLWQSMAVFAVAWLLAWVFRKNRARARYWLWMTASVKFLVPFLLLIAVGARMRSLVPAPAAGPAVATVMAEAAEPFTVTGSPDAPSATPAPQAVVHHYTDWTPLLLLAAWACGALVVLMRFAQGWMKVRAALRGARPAEIAAEIPVLLSPAAMEPGIVGILRPVLLLPEGILERLSAEQFRAILAHEMCHARRRDNFTFAMHMVVEVLFWFFPPVWWIGSRLIEERELACDEAVVEAGGAPQAYAEGILNVCKFCVESPIECVAGVTGADLKKRIVRIMTERNLLHLDWRKKAVLALAALTVIAVPVTLGLTQAAQTAPPAAATDIAGIWQGTLHIPKNDQYPKIDLRLVFKIEKTDAGALKAKWYSIDQGGQGVPMANITFQDGVLKFKSSIVERSYEGKMSADGKSITGTWMEGTEPIVLPLERATTDTAWAIPEPPKPMAGDAHPSFEVATIKPSAPGSPGKYFTFRGRHALTHNTNMNDLLSFAYGLHAKQIVGAPDWFDKDLFDIDGVPDVEGEPDDAQFTEMMQKLLADRFELKFHHEQRELSVYVITVAPGGPRMEKSDTPANQGGGFTFRGLGDLTVVNNTITGFANGMQGAVMDKPVVDRTGLTDRYNFQLKWTPDDSQFGQFRGTATPRPPPAGDNPNAPPSLYTAMPEQLGLKIEAGKAMDDVIVIDRVEKPSAN
jgi:uncharacterized protein (TIGR03435 family)